MSECTHGVASDFVVRREELVGRGTTVRIWKCSGCDKEARWGKTWSFFGTYECRKCGREIVQFVVCSDKCKRAARARMRAEK